MPKIESKDSHKYHNEDLEVKLKQQVKTNLLVFIAIIILAIIAGVALLVLK